VADETVMAYLRAEPLIDDETPIERPADSPPTYE
jgi:hypothetical protein